MVQISGVRSPTKGGARKASARDEPGDPTVRLLLLIAIWPDNVQLLLLLGHIILQSLSTVAQNSKVMISQINQVGLCNIQKLKNCKSVPAVN